MTPFTYVCLHVLLDHHMAGITEASPGYISEKLKAFERMTDEDAWCALDHQNKGRVIAWCMAWQVQIDPLFQENYDEEAHLIATMHL